MNGRSLRVAFAPALCALFLLCIAAPSRSFAGPAAHAATAGTDSLVLQPGPEGKDAGGRSTYPTDNWGTAEWYYGIGLPQYALGYVQFDLSALPGDAVVTSARLELWGRYMEGTVTLEPVATDWDELTLTWVNLPAVVSPAVAVTYPISRGLPSGDCYWGCVRSFDVTSIAAAWVDGTIVNRGFRILGNTPGYGWLMASGDNLTTARPKLSITYDSQTPVARPSWGKLKALYR